MTSLADAVLPLIRTRSDLNGYSAANAHGRDTHEAVDILEAAIPTTDPAEVYAVTHKALGSAVRVIARADDSSGIIGDACRRLLALHPQAAAAAGTPVGRLIDWMMKFQFGDDEVDCFSSTRQRRQKSGGTPAEWWNPLVDVGGFVADERSPVGQSGEPVPPDLALPVALEVRQPGGHLHQRRTSAVGAVRNAGAIRAEVQKRTVWVIASALPRHDRAPGA